MSHLLNPVFRSIAPKTNSPKNLPVHGSDLFAFRSNPNLFQAWIRSEA
jgi:hypothetical protein